MTTLLYIGGVAAAFFSLGFLLCTLVASGSREDAFRAGYRAGERAGDGVAVFHPRDRLILGCDRELSDEVLARIKAELTKAREHGDGAPIMLSGGVRLLGVERAPEIHLQAPAAGAVCDATGSCGDCDNFDRCAWLTEARRDQVGCDWDPPLFKLRAAPPAAGEGESS